MTEIKYPYKPKVRTFFFPMAFFVCCTVILVSLAYTNDRGFMLNGVVEFSVESASIFLWCLTLLSSLFVIPRDFNFA